MTLYLVWSIIPLGIKEKRNTKVLIGVCTSPGEAEALVERSIKNPQDAEIEPVEANEYLGEV